MLVFFMGRKAAARSYNAWYRCGQTAILMYLCNAKYLGPTGFDSGRAGM